MNTKTLIVLAATGIVAAPVAAFAALNVGDPVGTTEMEIRAALEAQGYVIQELEIEDDEIEVDAVLNGETFELEVDPASGAIVDVELADVEDDADEDDDDDDMEDKG